GGRCAASQSGLPPPVHMPAMSYMSFTAAVSLASGPCAAPARGSGKSCGTNALRKWCDADMLSPFALREIPIENLGAVPRDDAWVAENLLECALHVRDAVRNAPGEMPRRSSIFLSRQKPTRMPYSCQLQFGRSGNCGCPCGGEITIRAMGRDKSHS